MEQPSGPQHGHFFIKTFFIFFFFFNFFCSHLDSYCTERKKKEKLVQVSRLTDYCRGREWEAAGSTWGLASPKETFPPLAFLSRGSAWCYSIHEHQSLCLLFSGLSLAAQISVQNIRIPSVTNSSRKCGFLRRLAMPPSLIR